MNHLTICKYWAEANAKNISVENFRVITGEDFLEFEKKHHKDCMAAWNAFVSVRKGNLKVERIAKRCGDYCSCDDEMKLEPNGVSGTAKVPVRLWHCKVHGNRFDHFPLATRN